LALRIVLENLYFRTSSRIRCCDHAPLYSLTKRPTLVGEAGLRSRLGKAESREVLLSECGPHCHRPHSDKTLLPRHLLRGHVGSCHESVQRGETHGDHSRDAGETLRAVCTRTARTRARCIGKRARSGTDPVGSQNCTKPGHNPVKFGDKSVTVKQKNCVTIIKSAGKPVSRILSGAWTLPPARRGDHSSRSRFALGLQQPTRGS
jgi:hypothetical protein